MQLSVVRRRGCGAHKHLSLLLLLCKNDFEIDQRLTKALNLLPP